MKGIYAMKCVVMMILYKNSVRVTGLKLEDLVDHQTWEDGFMSRDLWKYFGNLNLNGTIDESLQISFVVA